MCYELLFFVLSITYVKNSIRRVETTLHRNLEILNTGTFLLVNKHLLRTFFFEILIIRGFGVWKFDKKTVIFALFA